MSVIRVSHNRENPYVLLNKEALRNPELSLRAVGLWARCMSRPNDWCFRVSEIIKSSKEGKQAIYKTLEELIKKNYVLRIQKINIQNSRFTGSSTDYIIFEFPLTEQQKQEELKKFFPRSDFQDPVKSTLLSKENQTESSSFEEERSCSVSPPLSEGVTAQARPGEQTPAFSENPEEKPRKATDRPIPKPFKQILLPQKSFETDVKHSSQVSVVNKSNLPPSKQSGKKDSKKTSHPCSNLQPKPKEDPLASSCIKQSIVRDEVIHCSKSDLYRHAIVERKNWRTEEIEEAWDILERYTGTISCWMKFVEGVIENLREKQRKKGLKCTHKNNLKQTESKKTNFESKPEKEDSSKPVSDQDFWTQQLQK
jgi:hypothetical protein